MKDAKPFVVQSASQFRTAGPYPLGSAAYAADYNEVKEIGSLTSATRMPGQTYAAAFWNTNPAANYNAIARRFVDQLSLDVSDSARLFAMLDLTAADALINTWNDKYHSNFWRPIFAIRQIGADDGNPATVADPTWTPLFSAGFPTSPPLPPSPLPVGGVGGPLGTPPYPDHPSGATAYASASMNALASFFGTDEMTFYATSSRFPGDQRTFNRFSDLTNEVLEDPHLGGDPFPESGRAGGNPRPRSRALWRQAPLRSRALRAIIVERPFGVAPLWPTPRGQGRGRG